MRYKHKSQQAELELKQLREEHEELTKALKNRNTKLETELRQSIMSMGKPEAESLRASIKKREEEDREAER